jgi:hypothetical protein
MDERRANIDLAFRNGLKDYEVLPPPDAWNNIRINIKRKERPAYLMRAAAFLAIAMTLSVLAYRWVGNISVTSSNPVLALNEESSYPATAGYKKAPVSKAKHRVVSSERNTNAVTSNQVSESIIPDERNVVSVRINLPSTNIQMPVKSASLDIIRHQSDFNGTQINTFVLDNVSQEYQDYITETNSQKNSPKWSVSALATPTYYGKINPGSDELSRQLNSSEQAVVSYTGGVTLSYNVNKRLSIQSGLFYSSLGQELEGINSFSGFQKYDNTKGDHNFEILTTNGTIFTNNADVFLIADHNDSRIITNFNNDVFDPQKASLDYINNTMRQNFSYLELPVFLRYKVIDRIVDLNLIGGLSYNLLVDNSVYTIIDGNKYMIGTTEGLNMFSISSSVGMGMEYNFSDKLSLNLEPTFRYYMNTFNSTSGSGIHPYSFGIYSGISYKF